ncbi:MAG: radical SAM protein [Candidatus Kapaibacterium sp.]
MYKYIFGPVPSRRLGISLGVDLIPPKICSLNCVYCESGRTTELTVDRREFVPREEVIAELDDFMHENPAPDYITFSGAGEPTLHSGIGSIIDHIKSNYPEIPVAVLTNGTLLRFAEVRRELMKADLVLPSLDASGNRAFRRINRPESSLDPQSHINGLIEFSEEFQGKIHLEVLLLPGYNMDDEELSAIESAIRAIDPDLVQLNTLDRPGAIEGLRPATYDELKSVIEKWGMNNAVIIASPKKPAEMTAYRRDTESAIIDTLRRRPCTAADIADVLGLHESAAEKHLAKLESQGRIEAQSGERGIFYGVAAK